MGRRRLNRRKPKTSAPRPIQPTQPRQQIVPEQKKKKSRSPGRSTSARSSLLSACNKLSVFACKLLGVSLLLYGAWEIWAATWPEPSFSVGAPSYGSPFDISFDVTNTSRFIDMREMVINCKLIDPTISTKYVENLHIQGTTLGTGDASTLKAASVRSYPCPFGLTIGRMLNSDYVVLSGRIQFVVNYSILYGLISLTYQSDEFSLDTNTIPPRWTPGTPMH